MKILAIRLKNLTKFNIIIILSILPLSLVNGLQALSSVISFVGSDAQFCEQQRISCSIGVRYLCLKCFSIKQRASFKSSFILLELESLLKIL